MGITGLLPFLKSIQHPTNVSTFQNQVVVVDAYCWLHKGCYSCSLELIEGKESEMRYVHYCTRKVDMLLSHNVTPILVFDGANLPSKRLTEEKRNKQRNIFREKGMRLLREGKRKEAYDCFKHCVDVKPEFALKLINACRVRGIQCIVAPYEADAQLAYMIKTGLAYAVISEDSDLLVFGCERVLFKMDDVGNGFLINLSEVGNVKGHNMLGFSEDSFRHMCILSGCDYLDNIPGIGLVTADKLMRKYGFDPVKAIRAVRVEKPNSVPQNYEESFQQANMTFLYQTVFDPRTESQLPLTPIPPEVDLNSLTFAGLQDTPTKAKGLARGNINPITNSIMGNYTPSKDGHIAHIPIASGIVEKHQKTITSFITSGSRHNKRTRPEQDLDTDQLMEEYTINISKEAPQFPLQTVPQNPKRNIFSQEQSKANTCVYSRFFSKPTENSFEVKNLTKPRSSKEVYIPDISKLKTLSLPIGDGTELVTNTNEFQDIIMQSQSQTMETYNSAKNTQNSISSNETVESQKSISNNGPESPKQQLDPPIQDVLSPDLLQPKDENYILSPDLLSYKKTENIPSVIHCKTDQSPIYTTAEPKQMANLQTPIGTQSETKPTTYKPRNPFLTPSKNSPISIVIPESSETTKFNSELEISSVTHATQSQPITSQYFFKQQSTLNYRRPLSGSGRPKRRPLTGQSRQKVLDRCAIKPQQK